MKREDILRMARVADAYADAMDVVGKNQEGLRDEKFAVLIEAAVREACAKVCEDTEFDSDADFYRPEFAAAIRARSQA